MIHWLTCQSAPRWRLLLPLAVAMALIVAACGDVRPAVSEPSSTIPGDPIVLASVRVDRLLADPDVQEIVQKLIAALSRAGAAGELLDLPGTFAEATGIDLDRVEELLLFVTIAPESNVFEELETAGGAIMLRGDFDLTAVLEALERSQGGPVETEGYKGQSIHVSGDDDVAIAFLERNLVVLAPPATIRAIVDVRLGESPGASGPVVESFQQMDPAFVKAVVAIPPGALGEALEEPDALGGGMLGVLPLLFDLSVLTELQTIALSLDKAVTRFEASATLVYADEATASRSRDIVEGLLQLAKGFAASEEIASSLDDVTVTVDGNELSIVARVHPRELDDIIERLEALFAIAKIETIFGSGEEPPEVRPERTRRFDSDEATPEPQPVLLPRLGSGEAPPTHTPARVREQREAR